MSDFDETTNGGDGEEEQGADFFSETEETVAALPETGATITLRTSGGDTKYIPVPAGQATMTVTEIVAASALAVSGAVNYWLNGVQVQPGDAVPAGAVLTLVGSVKGG
jgi:hypothetical protein